MRPAIRKALDLTGDDIMELSIGNEFLKNRIGSYYEKWLEESKTKLSKWIDYDKGGNLIMSRMQKQKKKINGLY